MPRPDYLCKTLCFALLSACAATAFAADQPAAEQGTARLRLFGQNAVMVKYYPNSKCDGGDSVSVSGGMGDAFSSFIGTAKNQSIGMPETPTTANLAARDGLMSKAYFREYEIAAGQPVTIAMGFREARAVDTVSCRTIVTTFVPEKGKDYEAGLDIRSREGVCVQTINEVSAASGGVVLTPVAVARAEACS